MNDPYYSFFCNAIRLSPILFMASTWLVIHYRFSGRWKVRMTFLVGYIIGVLSTWLYWDFAGQFAPNDEIAAEILSKDGAPRLFAPFVMPIFIGVYFLMMWPVVWGVTKILPVKNTAET